jgi:formate dehydrogenase subunit delta
MSPDKLAHMANQIGAFFRIRPHDEAVNAIAEHILKFWDPRMRAQILKHYAEGGSKLDPLVHDAVAKLAKDPATP